MSLEGECFKDTIFLYFFTVKGQLLSNHMQNIKQVDRIVYLFAALKI